MPKIRLFFDESLEEKKTFHIVEDNFHYLSNVMRCEVGSEVMLFNEKDGEYLSRLIEKDKKKIQEFIKNWFKNILFIFLFETFISK